MKLYAIREEEGVKWISVGNPDLSVSQKITLWDKDLKIGKPDLYVSQKVKFWDKDLKIIGSEVVTHEYDSVKDLDEVIRVANSAGTLGFKLTGESFDK